ncbi:hypothetical protein B7463_g9554, partial [Scytalidium lignicola]
MISPPKPFPYVKRWWTIELSRLRKEYNYRHNQWTSATRRGEYDSRIRDAARVAKQQYIQAIEVQKKQYWQEFLNDTNNVWKALLYVNKEEKAWNILILRREGEVAEEDGDKAEMLMRTFFPPQPEPEVNLQDPGSEDNNNTSDMSCSPISEEEVQEAIFSSNPRKAPGPDGIPFRAWQELWPVAKEWIVALYQKSFELGHVPTTWREAKIVVIRKPGKPDYTIPKAYRPISLLQTIGKGLEKVIARRISEYLERNNLLPRTQFGARPRRSTEHALMLLIEKIHDAWRTRKVLSLVTFDVQGAYNGVNKEVLKRRLEEHNVPRILVKWVYSFCSNRRACVAFEDYCSNMEDILHPGLPQGSSLSPIAYIVYNASLLNGMVNSTEGDMGFVDDYTAWVTGKSLEENTQRIQDDIIPRVVQWQRQSGATFEADKTQFIHFTRNEEKVQRPYLPIRMNGVWVAPSETVKILGVLLDSKLRMREQVQKAARKGMTQCIALGMLRGLRPSAMKQLYISTVASKLDYAASVWYKVQERGQFAEKTLEAVQRLGSRIITGAYRTAANVILEAECGLLPTAIRLRMKVLRYAVELHTLPKEHPWWQLKNGIRPTTTKIMSPLRRMLKEFTTDIEGETAKDLEVIHPFPVHLAIGSPFEAIIITEDRNLAVMEAWDPSIAPAIYMDGSARKGLTGHAVVAVYETAAPRDDDNEYAAELRAIRKAVRILRSHAPQLRQKGITILTDCQSVMKSLRRPHQQSGQYIIQEIIQITAGLRAEGTKITLRWVPAHEGVHGNELAHKYAQKSTTRGNEVGDELTLRLKSQALRAGQGRILKLCERLFKRTCSGMFTRTIDKALPQQHIAKVYSTLNSQDAAIVIQLRTGHLALNGPMARIHRAESARCQCGVEEETVRHFVFQCPQWTEQRQALREILGERMGDLSYALGGWSGRINRRTRKQIDGSKEKWKPNINAIKAVIQFVKATGRFQSQMAVRGEGENEASREGAEAEVVE